MNVMKLRSTISRWYSCLQNSYALDARSLAVFRIAVGFVVLVDLVRRFQHASILYSDAGVFSRTDAILRVSDWRWSVFFAVGPPEVVKAILGVGIFAAIAMILGWKTRIATVVAWVIIASIQVRNVGVNDGADNLIRLTMFWAMFLPLGRIWSIDSFQEENLGPKAESRLAPIVSLACFGLILQQAYMYWFTAMLKDGPQWTEESSALYYALGMSHVSRGFGDWLFNNAPMWILVALTAFTLVIEYAIPILLLMPLRSQSMRTVAVLLIWSLHLGIVSMMRVELFPFISIASAMGVMPALFWDSLLPRVVAAFSRMTRIPDQAWIRELGKSTPDPAPVHQNRINEEYGGTRLHFHPQPVKNVISGSTAVTVVCALAIVLSTLSNISNVSSYSMPSSLQALMYSGGLQQSWRMFAPQPGGNSIWYVVEGELASGDRVDLLVPIAENDMSARPPVVWDQSDDVLYPNKFWRKYFGFIREREGPKTRFSQYACQTWNAENDGEDRLERLSLTRGISRVLPNSERAEPVYIDLGSWDCR